MNHSASQNITAKVFKRSGLLSLARLLQVAVTFIIFWIFSLSLSKEAYGIYQKTFVLVSFFSGLCCLGLPILIASLPSFSTGNYILAVLKKSRFIYAFIIISSAVFILLLADFISLQARITVLILVLFNALYLVMETYLVKLQRDGYVLFNNIFYTGLYFVLHFAAVKQPLFQLEQLLLWLCCLSFARMILLFFFNRAVISADTITVTESGNAHYFNQWKFLSLNEALDIFSRQVDKLFLLWLLTAASFAVYFNGSYEIPLIGILISTTGTFITMQAVQQQDPAHVKLLLQQSTLILACILFPIFFFLLFNAGALFQVIFKGNYNDSIPVFLISCCIIPLRIMNYTAILQGYHKGKEILIGSVTGLIAKIIFSVILYIVWDVRGVALAFILGTFAQIIYYLIQTADLLKTGLSRLLPYAKLFLLFIIAGTISYAGEFFSTDFSMDFFLLAQGTICLLLMAAGIFFVLKKSKQ
ncbi:MAG: polysaccharide biosynthesis C-terminal domain-containing protein [Ferruginibacter sp.]